ncbi:MAG: Uma2 family endonuclease [Thermodesulfobacteriota bacterium]|nr:Uma2 family endonuclease [Thermodesulfobacteriota bacterium]
MSFELKPRVTYEEYLALERKAERKSEYFNGEIFAMAGASPQHVLIVTNVVSELRSQLKTRPCTVYSTDLRLKVNATGLYTYPDVIVVCGEPQFDDDHKDTLLNPTLIVEALSESTKDYDRGGKFEQYRMIESFVEYVLIAQNKRHVEHFVRQADNRWLLSETNRPEDTLELSSIACNLMLTEVYDKVELWGG